MHLPIGKICLHKIYRERYHFCLRVTNANPLIDDFACPVGPCAFEPIGGMIVYHVEDIFHVVFSKNGEQGGMRISPVIFSFAEAPGIDPGGVLHARGALVEVYSPCNSRSGVYLGANRSHKRRWSQGQ